MLNGFFSVIKALVRAQIYETTESFWRAGGHAPFPLKTPPIFLKSLAQSPPASNTVQKGDFYSNSEKDPWWSDLKPSWSGTWARLGADVQWSLPGGGDASTVEICCAVKPSSVQGQVVDDFYRG